jgi:hypothetical protein
MLPTVSTLPLKPHTNHLTESASRGVQPPRPKLRIPSATGQKEMLSPKELFNKFVRLPDSVPPAPAIPFHLQPVQSVHSTSKYLQPPKPKRAGPTPIRSYPSNRHLVIVFEEQVYVFEMQLKGFDEEMDLTRLVEYGKESMETMERVIRDIMRDVMGSMGRGKVSREEQVHTWCNGMLALATIANALVDCEIQVDRISDELRLLEQIAEVMIVLTPMMLVVDYRMMDDDTELKKIKEVQRQVLASHQKLARDGMEVFLKVVDRLDYISGPQDWTNAIALTDSNKLTVENVAKLPRDDNYRDSQRSQPSLLHPKPPIPNFYPIAALGQSHRILGLRRVGISCPKWRRPSFEWRIYGWKVTRTVTRTDSMIRNPSGTRIGGIRYRAIQLHAYIVRCLS